MPKFENPFSVINSDKKLNKEELIRAIRFMVAVEYEAVQMYTQLADSIEDEFSIKVLNDIANEEKVHAGEFLKLIKYLDPSEESFYQEGEKEVEKIKFSTVNQAIQYLADLTGKKIRIATNDIEKLVEKWIESKGIDMLPGEIKDTKLDLKNEDILINVKTTKGDEFTIIAPIKKVENK